MIKLKQLLESARQINSFASRRIQLTEGVVLDKIRSQIASLEAEWERLDSQGTGFARQSEIHRELQMLEMQKQKWDAMYAADRVNPSQINESMPAVLLGANWADGQVRYAVGNDEYARHPASMLNADNRWRYVPEINYLAWWVRPSPEERELVTGYLGSRGYKVKNQGALGYVNENKKLIMEARATPKMLEAFLREMITGSEWAGKVFLVGGFVRDELLGKEPKDADIVVGKFQGGVEFTTWLGKKLGIYHEKTNPVIFPTFGTANLRLDGVVWNGIDFNGESVDAVMFRKEQYHDPNSRKPTVQYADSIEEDASRRDLTFNSIYKDIATGKIIDPTGKGIEDLKNGIIRTPIDANIIYTDDALRMFRAVRFATQLGFELSPEVIEGIKNNLHRLGNTSMERVRDELNKILISKDPSRGIRLLKDTGLLPYVSKELHMAVGMTQNKYHSEDVFSHILTVLSKTKPTLISRLGALLHDIGKVTTRQVIDGSVHFYEHERVGADIAKRIMTDLKYPNNIIEPVVLAIRNHMRLKGSGKEGEIASDKSLRKFTVDIGDHLDDVMDIIHSDNISHAPDANMPNQIPNIIKRIEQLKNTIPQKGQKLPVTGEDLKLLGLSPGPLFKQLMDLVKDRQLEIPNTTKDEYLDMIKKYLKNNGI